MVDARNTGKVTYDEVGKVVRNFGGYYVAMGKLGYEMPSKHSEICSLKWMRAIRKGYVYCPKRAQVQVRRFLCYILGQLVEHAQVLESTTLVYIALEAHSWHHKIYHRT